MFIRFETVYENRKVAWYHSSKERGLLGATEVNLKDWKVSKAVLELYCLSKINLNWKLRANQTKVLRTAADANIKVGVDFKWATLDIWTGTKSFVILAY
jgi:hypothetical protein